MGAGRTGDVDADDGGSGTRQCHGSSAANPACGPGHDGYFARQAKRNNVTHHLLLQNGSRLVIAKDPGLHVGPAGSA
jgi:hypothetical protein